MDRGIKIDVERNNCATLAEVLDGIAVAWKDLGQEAKAYVANSLESDIIINNEKDCVKVSVNKFEEIEERLDRLEKRYENSRLVYSWEDRVAQINSRRDSFGYC